MRLTEIGRDRLWNLQLTSVGIPPGGAVPVGSSGQSTPNSPERREISAGGISIPTMAA